jgi:hypothetical protein
MRLRLLIALLLVTPMGFAGSITGVFQGTVVQLPASKAQDKSRWMYVQGKNGIIRRANIARASFEYDEDFPKAKRHPKAAESLLKAAVVRVTAEQDESKDGEWQATRVSIVSPPGAVKPKGKPSAITPTLAKR